ncbi:MAG: 1-acyl-sn-glycerol-3-phosphate acyltransferase [Oceanicaulis sp.]|uniref:lysophospholipid acyltransferase family protein n=1 Tax=Oceanicaulis sp. UBA2681 TaxID=1947007 RepID=UPI000C0964A1|nr:lysophospholipid acyltransferase family protein [Oceanicaulis sp. UBA2681]MAP48450.1 1-acyl-sn-glycerol-3-phosphate acyltransferase [Oceanicaulis sp.]|tara:strand:+ start:1960 stop:2679 length:720 start_codon:yes stop_codon:yes gene_type:complete
MRATLFHTGFWTLAGSLALACAPLLFWPGRQAAVWAIGAFSRLFRGWLHVCGVKLEYRGLEHIPADQPVIFAAKHQSYGDGLCHIARDPGLAYVIGDHMLRFPLVGLYLQRAGAVVVDNDAGRRANGALDDGAAQLARDQRSALIFPEGGLTPVGGGRRFRKGVHRLAQALNRPVIPVATNLGCFWPEQDKVLHPGTAVIEFLPAMALEADSRAFMSALQQRVQDHTRTLEAEALAKRP